MTPATLERPATKLPADLRKYAAEIDAALTKPLLKTWDDEIAYHEAAQPAAIGDVLVRAIHTDLVNATIGYLFKKKMARRDKTTLAQASKVGGKLAHYSHLDFLVEVNWERWVLMSGSRRVALIDHELSHFAIGHDDKTGAEKHELVAHDVEEFGAIVRRWGCWKMDLKRFADALEVGQQLDVFAKDETAGE